jgi:hypothetical protein
MVSFVHKVKEEEGDSDCGFCIVAGDTCEFTDLFYFPFFNFVFVFGSHEAGWKGTAGQALQNDEW